MPLSDLGLSDEDSNAGEETGAGSQGQFDQLRDSCLIESLESLGARCASASTAEMGALLQQSAALGQAAHFCALLLHVLARGDVCTHTLVARERPARRRRAPPGGKAAGVPLLAADPAPSAQPA